MTDSKNIQPQTRYTILLIGDSCIDEYKIGTVDRLSPEAPVPIIKITEEYVLPGMAGNVKKNIEKLGITECDFITNDGIIKKTRYIDKKSGQHILRVDSEAEIPPWSGRLWCRIDEFDAIIFSDYNKGFLTYENIEDIIKQTDIPIFIDTKKQNLDRFCGENVFVKIN
jgi:D-beta-D-heptose 7-phosphate kinase/D-beta-D-heptose 1-phosphate adenosyltransferase